MLSCEVRELRVLRKVGGGDLVVVHDPRMVPSAPGNQFTVSAGVLRTVAKPTYYVPGERVRIVAAGSHGNALHTGKCGEITQRSDMAPCYMVTLDDGNMGWRDPQDLEPETPPTEGSSRANP